MKTGVIFVLFFLSVQYTYGQINTYSYQPSNLRDSTATQLHFKNPRKAFWLSLGNTAIPIITGAILSSGSHSTRTIGNVLLVYGVIVGPAAGLLYSNDVSKAFGGIGFRTVISLAGLAVVATSTANYFVVDFAENKNPQDTHSLELAAIALIIGSAILAGADIYQIIQAPESAKKYNRSLKMSVSPAYFNREEAFGFAMNVRF